MSTSKIQAEIGQTRPFASQGQAAVIALLRTAAVVRRRIDAFMQPFGITTQQYNVLRILRGAGGPLPTMEVADRMVEPEPGITRLFGRLEAKGLVARHRCTEDGRRVLCSVTGDGLALLARIDASVTGFDDDLVRGLTPDQLTALLDILDTIRHPPASP